MIIAHLPSGYLLGRVFRGTPDGRILLTAALVGSVAPDIDVLVFLIDGRLHHHAYLTHWPLFWVALGLAAFAITALAQSTRWAKFVGVFLMGVGLHLALDSIAAPIYWLRPFGDGRVELFPAPAAYSHWFISMVFHWNFLLEIAVFVLAILYYFMDRRIETTNTYSRRTSMFPISSWVRSLAPRKR